MDSQVLPGEGLPDGQNYEDERDSGELIYAVQRFREDFKGLRNRIERMSFDALVALHEEAIKVSAISWVVRCIILGVAHQRAKRGDGSILELAKTFGISKRMAEIDIRVYNTFVKDDPDFEPLLPAHFYQIAAQKAENPKEAIHYALEQRYGGRFTASDFKRACGGETTVQTAPPGLYRMVPLPAGVEIDEQERTKLSAGVHLFSVNGELYGEVK